MTQALRLSKRDIAILISIVIAVAVVVAVVIIPRCSVFVQKLTGIAAKVSGDSALSSAAECTVSSNSKEVYFVSCGGFF